MVRYCFCSRSSGDQIGSTHHCFPSKYLLVFSIFCQSSFEICRVFFFQNISILNQSSYFYNMFYCINFYIYIFSSNYTWKYNTKGFSFFIEVFGIVNPTRYALDFGIILTDFFFFLFEPQILSNFPAHDLNFHGK